MVDMQRLQLLSLLLLLWIQSIDADTCDYPGWWNGPQTEYQSAANDPCYDTRDWNCGSPYESGWPREGLVDDCYQTCLLYTSDAADDWLVVLI